MTNILGVGDMIDKISILYRKTQRDPKGSREEFEALINELKTPTTILPRMPQTQTNAALINAIIALCDANYSIWELESDIRTLGPEATNKLGLEEIGRRALKIRDYNKKRIEAKNIINDLTKTGFVDKKVDHRSQ